MHWLNRMSYWCTILGLSSVIMSTLRKNFYLTTLVVLVQSNVYPDKTGATSQSINNKFANGIKSIRECFSIYFPTGTHEIRCQSTSKLHQGFALYFTDFSNCLRQAILFRLFLIKSEWKNVWWLHQKCETFGPVVCKKSVLLNASGSANCAIFKRLQSNSDF